jgi:hypothetical protein
LGIKAYDANQEIKESLLVLLGKCTDLLLSLFAVLKDLLLNRMGLTPCRERRERDTYT